MAASFVAAGTWFEANASPQTPGMPAGHVKDDWLLIFIVQSSASAITFSASGYTSLGRNSNATRTMTIEALGKLDNGSESAPSVSCSSATAGWGGAILAWRGGNRTTFEDAAAVLSDAAAAATFQPTGITTTTNGAMMISFAATKDDNALNFNTANGFTARASGAAYDGSAGNGSDYSIAVGDKIIAILGAATCPTWNQSVNGTDAWVALTLALKPAVDVTATPGVLALATSAFAPLVTAGQNVKVTPDKLSIALSSFAPSALAPRLVIPGKLAIALAQFSPTVLTPRLITPGKLSIPVSTFAPHVLAPRLVIPGTKNCLALRFIPDVLTPRRCTPGKLSISLTGFAPLVSAGAGGGGITAIPSPASLSITPFAPSIFVPRSCIPPRASLLITGLSPIASASRNVARPAAAAIALGMTVPIVSIFNPDPHASWITVAEDLVRFAP